MFVIISDRSKAVSRSSENLCLKCNYYHATTFSLTDQEERLCVVQDQRPMRLRGPVSRCTEYLDKNQPAKWEMDKMAWVIEVSKREVGFNGPQSVRFVPPSERKDIDQ